METSAKTAMNVNDMFLAIGTGQLYMYVVTVCLSAVIRCSDMVMECQS